MRFKVADPSEWLKRLEAAGIDADSPREGRVQLRLAPAEFPQHEALLKELVHQASVDSDA
jgi:hypothetical protein